MMLPTGPAPADAQSDWPLRRLADQMGLSRLPCPSPARERLAGANTPLERDALLAQGRKPQA